MTFRSARGDTVTIYCSSGASSDFGKVPVPDPNSEPNPDHLAQLFPKIFFTKSWLLMIEAALFPRKLSSLFTFFYFCAVFHFMLEPEPIPELEPEPECIAVPVPVLLRQKVAVPAIPVPVQQHCLPVRSSVSKLHLLASLTPCYIYRGPLFVSSPL